MSTAPPLVDRRHQNSIDVLLYDECEVYRVGARTVLESAADIVVVGEASTEKTAVDCARTAAPTVLVVGTLKEDVAMTVRSIIGQLPSPIAVLVLATQLDHEAVMTVLAAGARGYLHRNTPAARLRAAVRSVADGGLVLAPTAAGQVVASITALRDGQPTADSRSVVRSLAALTPRQREVLRLVAEGLSNAEIAHRMQVSVPTVKSHLSGLLHRLNVRDRTQLAVLAHQSGIDTLA